MSPASKAATVPVLSLAAHLLVEAGSALAHAQDMLDLVTWPEGERAAVLEAFRQTTRTVASLRMLIDGHTAEMTGRGDLGEGVAAALELLQAEIAE